MEMLKVKLSGKTLMMHDVKLLDPLNPLAKEYKSITSKKPKTDEDHELLARLEWHAGLYCNGSGPYIPARNVERCLVEAARGSKRGKDIAKGVVVINEEHTLQYSGPRDPEKMYTQKNGAFVDRRNKVVARSGVMRTRPVFNDGWSIEIEAAFDPAIWNKNDLLAVFELAGQYIGIGEERPRFGRFDVEEIA